MKQIAVLLLLRILREETDENHRLSQQMLVRRMQERFGVAVDRRTLKTYLDDLKSAGYPLCSTEKQRTNADGTVDTMQTKWYLEPDFEVSELRLLFDLLDAVPALPEQQRQSLQEKLCRFAAPSFRERAQSAPLIRLHAHKPAAPQLLFSVEMLCEAMQKGCMVSFQYCSYVPDGTAQPVQTPRTDADGTVREYRVSPYEIAVSHGRYYLICCKEPYRSISHYRIDRITEMHLLPDCPRVPLAEILGDGQAHPPMPQHTAEHLYMYSGDPVDCKFLADPQILGDIVDWFGLDLQMQPAGDALLISLRVHPTAMHHWALQYGRYVTVLEPESLRNEIAETAKQLTARYAPENESAP